MKKTISTILKVLSIIAAAITLIFAVFCIYDWVKYANTPYAYTIEFWLVIGLYAVLTMISSGAGLIFSLPNCFIADCESGKKNAKILTGVFVVILVVSVVLYFLSR